MKTVRWLHILFAFILSSPALLEAQQPDRPKIRAGILEKVREKGTVRVMVRLNTPWQPEERLSEQQKAVQKDSIAAGKKNIVAELKGTKFKVIREFGSMPLMAVELDAKALSVLDRSDRVQSVTDE